jgi:hypothetical protein
MYNNDNFIELKRQLLNQREKNADYHFGMR